MRQPPRAGCPPPCWARRGRGPDRLRHPDPGDRPVRHLPDPRRHRARNGLGAVPSRGPAAHSRGPGAGPPPRLRRRDRDLSGRSCDRRSVSFLLWPIATIAGFLAIPRLRVHWRGDGTRAPIWWSWSLAAMLAFLLAFSAVTFFGSHPLVGSATPYLDMTYHLALVGELRHHVPPAIPYVVDVPLAYHWFFYADAAATSWATGISPSRSSTACRCCRCSSPSWS